ncbi:MAG: 50S ribosomal protein L11 methyltransferase [Pseudomonadota bacterium]
MSSNISFKAVWRGPRAAMEIAETWFSEICDPPADAVWLTNRRPVEAESDDWAVEVYFADKPDLSALAHAIADYDPRWRHIAPGAIETVPDKDWVAHALEGLGVVEAGRFVLYGVHDADKVADENGDKITIRIDANQAFGTGHHPTTAGCLMLLDRLAGVAPKKVLDLGCGSAVLAIAAAKLWRRAALATDIDAASVEIARENVLLNDADGYVTVEEADGFDHPLTADTAPFDFVFANILAGPLKEFAPAMAAHTAKNGRVMLAGLMREQEAGVLEAYEAQGFRLLNRIDHETWPVLLLVRRG